MAGKQVPPRATALEDGAVYISVREAARVLGVAPSQVYRYLMCKKLRKRLVDGRTMLREEEVLAFTRARRARQTEAPPSHLLTILVPVQPGCSERLDARLKVFYEQNRDILPGTCKQFVARSKQEPGRMMLIFLWNDESPASAQERKQALDALIDDLAELCDWQQAFTREDNVLHASEDGETEPER